MFWRIFEAKNTVKGFVVTREQLLIYCGVNAKYANSKTYATVKKERNIATGYNNVYCSAVFVSLYNLQFQIDIGQCLPPSL